MKVLDLETGKIVKNVIIFNNAKTINSTTNNLGIADISDFKNDEFIFLSHLSYASFRVKKSELEKNNFVVYLTKESEQLDEVVLSVFKSTAKTSKIAEQIEIVSLK
ncbi:MAG: TonB-dependent receptor, partial [Polaribacter sp.]